MRSSSRVSNFGYDLILKCFPDTVLPRAPVFWFAAESWSYTARAGAMVSDVSHWMVLARRRSVLRLLFTKRSNLQHRTDQMSHEGRRSVDRCRRVGDAGKSGQSWWSRWQLMAEVNNPSIERGMHSRAPEIDLAGSRCRHCT